MLLGFLPPWPSPAGGDWGPPEESPAAAVVGLYRMAFCMMASVCVGVCIYIFYGGSWGLFVLYALMREERRREEERMEAFEFLYREPKIILHINL